METSKKCIVFGCTSEIGDDNISFHYVPANIERKKQWLENVGREDLISKGLNSSTYKICGKHFSKETFGLTGKTLKRNAIPNVNAEVLNEEANDRQMHVESVEVLPPLSAAYNLPEGIPSTNSLQAGTVSVGIQTATPDAPPISEESYSKLRKESVELIMTMRRQHKELRVLKARRERKNKKVKDDLLRKLPASVRSIIQNILDSKDKDNREFPYKEDFMQYCLILYFSYPPGGYKFLTDTMGLPTRQRLLRYVHDWPLKPGLNDLCFKSLQLKGVTMSDIAKHCIICMDEMPLQANLQFLPETGHICGFEDDGYTRRQNMIAKNALVVLVRGITHNYRHFLGYVFTHSMYRGGKLHRLLEDTVEKLVGIGFKPKVFVCDQAENFQSLAMQLGVSEQKTSFSIHGNEIFFLFDPPHLIKSIRDNLLKYNIEFGNGKVASWLDISKFYHWDTEKGEYRLAPKLTNSHINPNNFDKLKVKKATQIFSATVTSGIRFQVSANEAPAAALHTAEFIENFDSLFDIFNSSTFLEVKETRRPYMADPSQKEFLIRMEHFIKSIVIKDGQGKDVTKNIKCIEGWLIAIKSLITLHESFKDLGINFLLTRYLNQEALELSFSAIRRRGDKNGNLTPYLFSRAFKRCFALKYLEAIKGGNWYNC